MLSRGRRVWWGWSRWATGWLGATVVVVATTTVLVTLEERHGWLFPYGTPLFAALPVSVYGFVAMRRARAGWPACGFMSLLPLAALFASAGVHRFANSVAENRPGIALGVTETDAFEYRALVAIVSWSGLAIASWAAGRSHRLALGTLATGALCALGAGGLGTAADAIGTALGSLAAEIVWVGSGTLGHLPIAAVMLSWAEAERRNLRTAGCCLNCDYSRAGLAPAAPCPECGAAPQGVTP